MLASTLSFPNQYKRFYYCVAIEGQPRCYLIIEIVDIDRNTPEHLLFYFILSQSQSFCNQQAFSIG